MYEEPLSSPVPRQGCLEEDVHELGPAPGDVGGRAAGLGAERCRPEPRRIEPRRPSRLLFPASSSNGHYHGSSPPLQLRKQALPSSSSLSSSSPRLLPAAPVASAAACCW